MSDIKQYEPLWGSWYVDSLLGEGSFGKVYKVHKEEFGNTYEAAVKIISIPQSEADLRQAQSDGLDADSVRSYFHAFVTDIIQEIDLMSAFRGNSNIVSLEDHKVIEREDDIGWDILIRMELLTTLSSYVTQKPMEPDEVIKLGVHICRALELCALRKTIHRDIKPDNIFVSQYGDYKLGDFGIARQIERTMSGLSKKGTYTYMAPEVFKGDEYGASVDLYSLGIVMYRFLNKNRTPFLPDFPNPITPHDRDEALQRRMGGEPLPPIPDIDAALNDIVLKACAYDRADRFSNATEMKLALAALSSGEKEINLPTPSKHDVEKVSQQAFLLDAASEGKAQDFGDDGETVSIFSSSSASLQDVQGPNPSPVERLSSLLRVLSIVGGICFGLLGFLTFVSGNRSDIVVFLPLYVFCVVQCVLRYRNKIINNAFLLSMLLYLCFTASRGFRFFDYSFLILTLSLLSLETTGDNRRKYRIILCIMQVVCGLVSMLWIRYIQSVASYGDVAGAIAIPLLFLFTILLALLLPHQPMIAYGLLGALQLFPLIAFIAYRNGASIFFYIANANFTGFSPERFSWWHYGRFMGLVLQFCAYISLLMLAAAKIDVVHLSCTLDRKNWRKTIGSIIIFVVALVAGLTVLPMIPMSPN